MTDVYNRWPTGMSIYGKRRFSKPTTVMRDSPAIFAEANFWGKKIWIPKYWHLFAFVCFFAYGWFHYGTSPLNPPFGAYFFIFVPPPWANQSCLLLFCGRFRSSNPPSIDTFLQETCGVHGTWYLDPKFLEPFVSWGSFHHLVLVGMTYPPVKSPSSW